MILFMKQDLTYSEEKSVEQYCLWQHERRMNLDNHAVKAIFCDIYVKTVEQGEICQPINKTDGPSRKCIQDTHL